VSALCAPVHAAGRSLPRGWRHLLLQLVIWFGFLGLYQVVRGLVDRNPAAAFTNGLRVIDLERSFDLLFEQTFQRLIDSSGFLTQATVWTYWNSQFTVVGLTLLFVYLRRNEAFARFRNWILLANVLGLVCFAFLPTAPPRMFPDLGFADTLAAFGALDHGSGLVQLASNPYAAMPSLHSADALIVGVSMALVSRRRLFKALWLLWPAWVWFCVMATGNHFWLDVAGGIVLALIALAILVHGGRLVPRARRATA
jgi:membrane-associated phospholipid phosphatase